MLHVDIPANADLKSLAVVRDDLCVSIYQPTTPVTREGAGDRIEFKNLCKQALSQLDGGDKRRLAALSEHLDDLVDDDAFWRYQARSLAVLATPDSVRTFRLPNALKPMAEVSDRFHLKPLFRAVSFPNVCYVLALAENGVRLVEVPADLPPVTVKIDALPKNAADAVHRSTVNDRSPSGRLQGSEGQKILLGQYARRVDGALRPLLTGSDIPLVLAATEPLASIYRSVNTYAHLAPQTISGSPERLSDADLADAARPVLDGLYKKEIAALAALFETRRGDGRATSDIAQAARAATAGAVETLLFDFDEVVPGTVDSNGAVAFADGASAHSYGVVDEIADRVLLSGGRLLAVRRDDIPGGASLAAILRYAV